MADLFQAARWFDDVPIYDGYTNAFLFNGQYSTYDEGSPDGTTSKRRILSLDPSFSIPLRRSIKIEGENWLVGDGLTDSIFGEPIRKNYWIKKVTDIAQFRTPLQVCNGDFGTTVHTHKQYLKDTVNGITNSQYDPFWNIFYSGNEVASRGYFISFESKLTRVRGLHLELEGLMLAGCDELDDSLNESIVAVSVDTVKTYNPITDTYTTTSGSYNGIKLDAYKLYNYNNQAEPKVNAADITLILPVEVPTGRTITVSGKIYRVSSVNPDLDAWSHNLTRL